MIAVEQTVLILLAAGRSSRFGAADKLEQHVLGRPVGLHVVVALEDLAFHSRLVVSGGCRLDFARHGFETLRNDDPDQGLARSVRIGVERARTTDAQAVLIALADMPRVTATHVHRMLDAADPADAVVASSDGRTTKPPAIFGRGRFDFLMRLQGQGGARDLVRAGRHVVTTPAELVDIDTPDDLDRLRRLIHAPEAIIRGAARRSD